jgi:uncharacterized membrane protein
MSTQMPPLQPDPPQPAEETVSELDTTVAVYDDRTTAETDWSALEDAASSGQIKLADAAIVENNNGESVVIDRQSRSGWGKGAIVGAVVGVLFPPSLIAAAAVGAGGGALVARMTRVLDRSKVKDLGETLDSGTVAIIVVSPFQSTYNVSETLKNARTKTTVQSATVEEIQEVIKAG